MPSIRKKQPCRKNPIIPEKVSFVGIDETHKFPHDFYASVDFCRDLERELLTARNDAFNLANALSKAEAEVERLKKMVMEAARKGDELLEPYRLRAEKAETLLKQIHAFVEALNTTNK